MADDVLTPEEMGDVLTPEELGGAPSPVPGLDVAPRPSRYPGPRPVTDADLGIESPIDYGRNILGSQRTAPGPYQVDGGLRVNGHTRPSDPMEVDPIAQAVATSTVLGPLGRMATGALPRVLAPAVSALEGGAASKSMGGDFLPGFGLGGALGAAGLIARQMAPSAAAARGQVRMAKDVNKGVTSASKAVADDVKFVAGEGNADLAQVAKELPEVDKALRTQAKTNPGAAMKTTDATLSALTDANDEAYAAIQRQHKGVPLKPVLDRLEGLEERLNLQGRDVAADAVARARKRWAKRYGGVEDAKLSAQQIRNIRNDLGTVIDPAKNIEPNTKRAAQKHIYDILNKEIEDVAADTRGVDVAALKARNRQISTLIPVRDALADRVDKLADIDHGIPGLKDLAKGARRVGQRAVRTVDYGLSRIPIGGELAPGRLPVAVPVSAARFGQDQDFARKVTDGMGSGLSLQDAVSAAGGE